MTIWLKQSTASQEIPLGIFVDSTDGNTEESGLTVANTDIKIWKTGATTLASKNSGGATYISNGIYYAVLDATDTDTLGPMVIFVHVSGALAVKQECLVLPANIYDSFVAGSDNLDVNTMQWLGTACATPTVAGVPEVDLTHVSGDAQSATDLKDFADAGYDPATNKVQGVVLTDTVTTYTGNTVQTGDSFARLGAPTGASVSVDVAAIKTQTAAIETDTQDIQTRIPAALVSGRMSSDLVAISGSTTAADRLELSALRIVSGTAQTGTLSTTVMTTDLTEATTDHYKGRVIIWTSGVLVDQATDITAYSGSGGTLTYTAITEAPSNGDTFIII